MDLKVNVKAINCRKVNHDMLDALFIWKQLILFEHIRAPGIVSSSIFNLNRHVCRLPSMHRAGPRKSLMFNATSLL